MSTHCSLCSTSHATTSCTNPFTAFAAFLALPPFRSCTNPAFAAVRCPAAVDPCMLAEGVVPPRCSVLSQSMVKQVCHKAPSSVYCTFLLRSIPHPCICPTTKGGIILEAEIFWVRWDFSLIDMQYLAAQYLPECSVVFVCSANDPNALKRCEKASYEIKQLVILAKYQPLVDLLWIIVY